MNIDKLSLTRIETAHPLLRKELLAIYKECAKIITNPNVKLRFTSVLRTDAEQNELYAQGRTKSGAKVTWVRGGGSYHNYGMAVDIALLIDTDNNGSFETASWDVNKDWDKDGTPDWKEIVKVFESYGWQWGVFNRSGRRIDLPHFQKTLGYKTSELRKLPRDSNGYAIINK